MAATAILELYLDGYFKYESDSIIFERDNGNTLEYHDIVLDILLGKSGSLKETLPEFITKVKKLSKSNLEDIEEVFVTYFIKIVSFERITFFLCFYFVFYS